jgi:hypothetical protein
LRASGAIYEALVDFQQTLVTENPDAAIVLVVEVLRIEPNLALLEILAATCCFRQ